MATVFSHALTAIVMGKIFSFQKKEVFFWIIAIYCSILPDADIIGFAFGIKYGDVFGHRGFFHSLVFAFIVGILVVWVGWRSSSLSVSDRLKMVAFLFLVTSSHGVLDAMTDGGFGVAFFSPIDTTRYFLPWRPLKVSPIGAGEFFTSEGAQVMMSEFTHLWIPMIGILCLWAFFKRTSNPKSEVDI